MVGFHATGLYSTISSIYTSSATEEKSKNVRIGYDSIRSHALGKRNETLYPSSSESSICAGVLEYFAVNL